MNALPVKYDTLTEEKATAIIQAFMTSRDCNSPSIAFFTIRCSKIAETDHWVVVVTHTPTRKMIIADSSDDIAQFVNERSEYNPPMMKIKGYND